MHPNPQVDVPRTGKPDAAGALALFGLLARFATLLSAVASLMVATPRWAYAEHEWQADWEITDALKVEIDAAGFRLPTAIAFVSKPSSEPDAPRYFVTELRGAIKVVTNDGAVRDFASVETFAPTQEYPYPDAEGGLAGLCLDDATGYVFATYLYQDGHGVFRNALVRFATAPRTFAVQPTDRLDVREPFATYASGFSHQIGGCVVRDGSLYVGVGDGLNAAAGQEVAKLAGKILRMDLDGRPQAKNPFVGDPDRPSAAYVWAYGVRNPFGLAFVGERLFAIENGPDVDGLREIERGRNYYWDGTNWSIGVALRLTFWPPLGPVHLTWLPARSAAMPKRTNDQLLIAVSGGFMRGMATPNPPGVVAVNYDAADDRFEERPRYVARFRGKYEQRVTGIAVHGDAIYFAAMLPDPGGRAYVLRLTHDPSPPQQQARAPGDPLALMTDKGCFACHQLDGTGGTQGPSLDKTSLLLRLKPQLSSALYEEQLRAIDAIDEEPFRDFRQARENVRTAAGDEKLRTWVKYRVMEPRFDRTETAMPNLGVTEAEAEQITRLLLGGGKRSWREALLARLQTRKALLAVGFGAGTAATLIPILLLAFVRKRSRGA